jgi:ferredoxin
MAIRVSIDWAKCQGNGVCARVAPEVFKLDKTGFPEEILEAVPDQLRPKVSLAVRQCPTEAISAADG